MPKRHMVHAGSIFIIARNELAVNLIVLRARVSDSVDKEILTKAIIAAIGRFMAATSAARHLFDKRHRQSAPPAAGRYDDTEMALEAVPAHFTEAFREIPPAPIGALRDDGSFLFVPRACIGSLHMPATASYNA